MLAEPWNLQIEVDDVWYKRPHKPASRTTRCPHKALIFPTPKAIIEILYASRLNNVLRAGCGGRHVVICSMLHDC